MATVICVSNQKGGVGKTTTAVNLAFYLGKDKFSTLLIDFDPQGNATSGLGINQEDLEKTMTDVAMGETGLAEVVTETKYKNLSIAPTSTDLANAEVEMANLAQKFTQLKRAISAVEKDYDYIIIDCPPSLSLLTVNAMIAADYLLLPVQTEFYALEGVAQLLETMKLIKKAGNPNLKLLGVVATMYDKRTSLSRQVLEEIKKYFKDLTFEVTIPRNIRVAEAPSHGAPVGGYDALSRGARAYKEFAKEVEERTGKGKK